jgi:hypothetical protein
MVFLQNHGEGGSCFVQLRPQPQGCALLTGEREMDIPFSIQLKGIEPLDDLEGFLVSLRFEHRSKLGNLGIENSTYD